MSIARFVTLFCMQLCRIGSARARCALMLWAALAAACGGAERSTVVIPSGPDSGQASDDNAPDAATSGCVDVDTQGDEIVEHLQDFTARFERGAAYDRTVMLFGGMQVAQPNAPRRAYIYGLDKVDAQRMAMKYPDFYLCSSPGGQEAATYIEVYDIIPASCKVYQQLVTALRVYNANVSRGGDRTSLRLEGAPLTVTSVTGNATGQDVSAQVSGERFHLITAVQQLTGESVLDFGTMD